MSLISRLRAQEADAQELSEFLLGHFRHGRGAGERRVRFSGPDGAPGLTITYDRKGKISKIDPDETLPDSEIELLQAEITNKLLIPGPSLIARAPLFANIPTDGWHRYRDVFQISSAPPHAPRPQQFWGWHPFQIEVRFTSSCDLQTSLARRIRALREIELLLAALLTVSIRTIGSNAAIQHWVLDRSDAANPRSILAQEHYAWDGVTAVEPEFTETEGLKPMERTDYLNYYRRYGYYVDSRLDVPNTLNFVLDEYFALDKVKQQQFQRAAYWFQFAKETWSRSQSAAYIAFVSAMESLKEVDRDDLAHCPTCNQRVGTSATGRFTELLDRLAPVGNIAPEDRSLYFRLRSALAHGDKLFQDDITRWPMNMSSMGERDALRGLSGIVQAALYNWLWQKAVSRAVPRPNLADSS